MQSVYTLLRDLIPEHLHAKTFIAGGAAIAPHTSPDVDVWVLGNEATEIEVIEGAYSWEKKVRADILLYEDPVYREFVKQGNRSQDRVLVGTIKAAGLKPIQVLHASGTGGSPTLLLEEFDLTVHQWAVPLTAYSTSVLFRASTSTLPSQLPRVVDWVQDPIVTLRRLRKVLTRYGWPLNEHPDYLKLRERAEHRNLSLAFAAEMSSVSARLTEVEIPF